jgi:trimethylamine--corrinoid protein Co-methyltransferase
MPSETPRLKPIIRDYSIKILKDAQLSQVKQATLDVLADVGIHSPSKQCLEIYAEHGAIVDFETHNVKIPPDVVIEAMSHAPRYYTMGARLPEFDLKLDGQTTYLATDGTGVETVDFKTGQRRNSVKDDVAKMARVTDYLPSLGFYWPMVSAQDHPLTACLHELEASLLNTVKHIQTPTVVTAEDARAAIEMAQVVGGDKASLRERSPLSFLICTIAPLAHDRDSMEAALVFAEAGIPVGFMSMGLAGSTAPASIAGTMLIGDAEMVSAMVLIQMAYPGAPVYYSMMPGVMHPRTGAFLGNALNGDLMYSGGVQLADMWGVPTLAGVGPGSSESGWDSAAGIASSMLLCVLAGAETISGIGLRESCTLLFPESLVLDSELYDIARVEAAGIDISAETLAIDVIKQVGPNGHYLNLPHTRDNIRKLEIPERILSTLGSVDPIEYAKEKTDWILKNHKPEPLPEAQQKELKRIVQAADQRAN